MIDYLTQQFYEKNKELNWIPPPVPTNITSDKDVATWITQNNDIGWVELDIKIALDIWKEESKQASKYFVDHRGQEHPGWNSCCIHGIDIDKTGSWTNYGYDSESEVRYKWTDLAYRVPVITNFWKNIFPSETYRRIRFMELEPNGYIAPHSDMPEYTDISVIDHGIPVNIAITHPEDCYMVIEGCGIVPWKEGKVMMLNIRKYHSVINFSNSSRIHMIGHGTYGKYTNKFCELIARSYRKQYENYT